MCIALALEQGGKVDVGLHLILRVVLLVLVVTAAVKEILRIETT